MVTAGQYGAGQTFGRIGTKMFFSLPGEFADNYDLAVTSENRMNQMTFRFGTGLVGLAAITLGHACIRPPGQIPPLPVADHIDAEFIVSGADFPAAQAFADDGRVFYTEKNSGRIRVIADDVLLPEPFAELATAAPASSC